MQVEIIDYNPMYKEAFKRINVEWIQQYFVIEPADLKALDHPEDYILNKGGKIIFAKVGEEIAGTVALIKVSDTSYELAKMGVSPRFQGLGVGKKLGEAILNIAKSLGANHVFLESNQKLTPALTLYKALGFVEIPVGETPYSRADYKAELFF